MRLKKIVRHVFRHQYIGDEGISVSQAYFYTAKYILVSNYIIE